MLKALLKKQFAELAAGLFQGRKKTRKIRSGATVLVVFLLIMLALAGTFTLVAMKIAPLISAGLGWMYFLIMNGLALIFGIMGSVFSTYTTLYQAKDNDLLLSMPIPTRYIMFTRLLGVYLTGLVYIAAIMIPAQIVYCVTAGATVRNVLCGIAVLILTSLFVLTVSCALGWVVAKINSKVKNKNVLTIVVSVISIGFIGAIYYVQFNSSRLLSKLLENGETMAKGVKGSAYPLYMFGSAPEGDLGSLAILAAVVIALFALTCFLMSRGFIKLSTGTGAAARIEYKEKPQKTKSVAGALLAREFKHFSSSTAYMLNCALGTVLLVAAGVVLIVKGGAISGYFASPDSPGKEFFIPIICAAICFIVSMNMITVPSISLEGRTVWLLQSLPVKPGQVLTAKMLLHVILTNIPALFCSICAVAAIGLSPLEAVMIIVIPQVFAVLVAALGLYVNLRMPRLDWTNETAAIKQSFGALIVIFGSMILSAAFLILWIALFVDRISSVAYMTAELAVIAALTAVFLVLLKKQGAKLFAALG